MSKIEEERFSADILLFTIPTEKIPAYLRNVDSYNSIFMIRSTAAMWSFSIYGSNYSGVWARVSPNET